jgi:hypothetical protein
MSAVAEAPHDEIVSRTTEELYAEFEGLFGRTVTNLIRMAEVVAELERRNADLSRLRCSMVGHLRRIAAKQLLPEAVLAFQFRPAILNSVAQLPVAEQQRLVESPEVEVYMPGTDATETVELENLHINQARAVFGNGRIRTPAEQRVYMCGAVGMNKEEPAPVQRTFRVRPDKTKGGVWVGQAFVKAPEIVAALADLAGPLKPLTLDDSETATARLAVEEKEKLRASERRLNLPEHHLIRQALRAYGLI